jgi:hypothetical protein
MVDSFSTTVTARPFRLSRWFAIVGLIAIVLLSVTCAELLSLLFTNRMLGQEGTLTTQFVQNIIDVERASIHFESMAQEQAEVAQSAKLKELLQHFAALPDVLRVNLYSPEHRILWSSDPTLVGRSFPDNPELDSALTGAAGRGRAAWDRRRNGFGRGPRYTQPAGSNPLLCRTHPGGRCRDCG